MGGWSYDEAYSCAFPSSTVYSVYARRKVILLACGEQRELFTDGPTL